ncbi:hypothetical protein BX616_000744 [Lobosporangium transversale]|nr:hypothetical protein BX616_000744 [Lobosporangium transversale]
MALENQKKQSELEQHQLQQRQLREMQEAQKREQQKRMIQQTDALNLARYLAQSQTVQQQQQSQIKLEQEQSITASSMEHDTVSMSLSSPSSPASSCLSSLVSEAGGNSPLTSPTLSERSIGSEISSDSADTSTTTTTTPATTVAANATAELTVVKHESHVPNCDDPLPSATSTRQLECFNCKVTQTPLWRRTPDRKHSLCNACGLYYKQYGAHRPLHVRHKLLAMADVRSNTLPYARPLYSSGRGSSPVSSLSDSDSESAATVAAASGILTDLTKIYTEALVPGPVTTTSTAPRSPPLMTAKQGIQCVNCLQTQTPLWRKNEAGEPICNACGLYAKLHHRDRPVTMRKAMIARRRRDWGGNLAQRAAAQAKAEAEAQAQVQDQGQGQGQGQGQDQVSTRAQVEVQTLDQFQAEAQVQGHMQAETLYMNQKRIELQHQDLPVLNSNRIDDQTMEESIVEEMSRRAQELTGRHRLCLSNEGREEKEKEKEHTAMTTGSTSASNCGKSTVAQSLSNNLIMDESKFADVVGQMNAHQMNRFLSILETRCGVLRERLLASTEVSRSVASASATANATSPFDDLF